MHPLAFQLNPVSVEASLNTWGSPEDRRSRESCGSVSLPIVVKALVLSVCSGAMIDVEKHSLAGRLIAVPISSAAARMFSVQASCLCAEWGLRRERAWHCPVGCTTCQFLGQYCRSTLRLLLGLPVTARLLLSEKDSRSHNRAPEGLKWADLGGSWLLCSV